MANVVLRRVAVLFLVPLFGFSPQCLAPPGPQCRRPHKSNWWPHHDPAPTQIRRPCRCNLPSSCYNVRQTTGGIPHHNWKQTGASQRRQQAAQRGGGWPEQAGGGRQSVPRGGARGQGQRGSIGGGACAEKVPALGAKWRRRR